jgi:outer membrane PBP1 activator LpoA protein
MRVLTILALALSLAGCNGDSIKQSMNGRQAQPQSKWIAHLNGGSIADGDPQAS